MKVKKVNFKNFRRKLNGFHSRYQKNNSISAVAFEWLSSNVIKERDFFYYIQRQFQV